MRIFLVIALFALTGCCNPWDPRCSIKTKCECNMEIERGENYV